MNETWVTLSEKAASKLQEIMAREGQQPSSLRVAVVRTHCMGGRGFTNKLQFAVPAEDDEVFEHNGVKVCVDQTSVPYLKGSEVDYTEADGEAGFTINNPNVRSKCPCGHHDIFE